MGFMPNYKIHMLQKQKNTFDSYLVMITLTCLHSLQPYTILSDSYHHVKP